MVQTTSTSDMTKAYDPKSVEQRVYDFWVRGGYFTPVIDRSKKPYVVIMPPPNVTGELHMGHALTMALEDLMVRWHRMIGDPTLYLPGTDHAGIATQVVVERQLASDDKTRHDLGRQAFVDLVWEWVDQYGDRIYEQIKRLGASCDWTRRSFTLDEGPSKAVRTTFVNLYREGLIYRGERIVNWCPRCSTALSDLEVRHREEGSGLYHLRYRLQDSDDHLTIATTRPETLLGDTAVAVNPNDDRYSHLVGRTAVLPVLGRVLPVIADDTVDTEFGNRRPQGDSRPRPQRLRYRPAPRPRRRQRDEPRRHDERERRSVRGQGQARRQDRDRRGAGAGRPAGEGRPATATPWAIATGATRSWSPSCRSSGT